MINAWMEAKKSRPLKRVVLANSSCDWKGEKMSTKLHSPGDDVADLNVNDVLRWEGGRGWCLVYGCQPALEFDWYLIPPETCVDAMAMQKSEQKYEVICFRFGEKVAKMKGKNDPQLIVK
jgi:hypothetical protein